MSQYKSRSTCSLTVDVEEYFQVEAFAKQVDIADWSSYESRISFQMDKLLELFETKNIKATFFILGIIAEKHPELIKKVARMGHEVASHGYYHQHITKQSEQEFTSDIKKSKSLLEDLTSAEVIGYRAPCFSITKDNTWAHEAILNAGFQYSSSTYPIIHDLYGVPKAPRSPYTLDNGLLEIPVSTSKVAGRLLPAGGGGYFRLLPYFIYKFLLTRAKHELGYINFYTHPWEYDPNQPKINSSFKSNFRHRVNQNSALNKLTNLCEEYQFDTLANIHLTKSYPTLGKWENISQGIF